MRLQYFSSYKIFIIGIFTCLILIPDCVYSSNLKPSANINLTPEEKLWIKNHSIINISGPKAFPPFYFTDESNQVKGISAEHLDFIINAAGIKTNIHKNIPWSNVLEMVKEKKIDLVACIAKTRDREAYLNFSDPYLSFPLVIINRQESDFVGGVEDLEGKTLAVIKDASPYTLFNPVNFNKLYVTSPLHGLRAVSFGQADARIENLAAASYLIQKQGLSNLKIAAPTSYKNYTLHMAVRKDFPELLSIMNKALKAMPPSEKSEIQNRWLSVRYDHGLKIQDVLQWLVPTLIFSIFIVILMLTWNRRLKKESEERKKIEAKLRASEQRYKHLFDNAPTGMYEVDFVQNKFISANEIAYSYSGYTKEEFFAKKPLEFLTPKSQKLYLERLSNINDGKDFSEVVEYQTIKKDGSLLTVLLDGDYFFEGGQLVRAQVVVHDITKLKKTEEEKIKAQKLASEHEKLALVGKIAGKMAHDFNNILGIIMGNIELCLIDCKDPDIKKSLELIFNQTLRGKNLTRNLVAFAKDQEPKQEFFKLNKKIDLVLNLLKKDLNDIRIIRQDASDVPELLADPGMIEHAMVNLLQNSIHALSQTEAPQIIIRTYASKDMIFLEVEENGCGIPEEYLERIYEPAFSLKGSRDVTQSYKQGIKGTGYGMANIKKHIEQHKGTITVESEINMGSKFIIALPIIEKALTHEEKTQFSAQKIITEKRILLVEDETDISDVQYRILTHSPCNHNVDIAKNASCAIELFNKNTYDFISLDYILPGNQTGMDIYKHIRAHNSAVPVLFISGNFTFLESIKELKQKDDYLDHLSKPCRNKDYIASMNQLLQKTAL